MDFYKFKHKYKNEKNTILFLFFLFFAISLSFVVLSSSIFFYFYIYDINIKNILQLTKTITSIPFWLYSAVSIFVVIIVFIFSFSKISKLSHGGKMIAFELGAMELIPKTLTERTLVNIVEEMAISSRLKIPNIYVLEHESINIFTAGFSQNDAIIGITRGALYGLTRDELQGMVAHAFSQIQNGNMRLNMQITSFLYIYKALGFGIFKYHPEINKTKFKNVIQNSVGYMYTLACFPFIFLLYVFHNIGTIIKKKISYKNTLIADAQTVEFTRYSQGLSNVLKKIGGQKNIHQQSLSAEYSHMFLFDVEDRYNTYIVNEKLYKRIKNLDVNWDGIYIITSYAEYYDYLKQINYTLLKKINATNIFLKNTNDYLAKKELRSIVPKELFDFAKDSELAEYIIYSILLPKKDINIESKYICSTLTSDSYAKKEIAENLQNIHEKINLTSRDNYLPLIILCINSLKKISKKHYGKLNKIIIYLTKQDRYFSIFEFGIAFFAHELSLYFNPKKFKILHYLLFVKK
ncbi:MAG: M48 family metalloprotease [Campylobacteraceae bacterium]